MTSLNFYLVGRLIANIPINGNLPTAKQVFKNFLYKHYILNMNIKQSLAEAVFYCEEVWKTLNVPTKKTGNSRRQLNDIYVKWLKLKKNKNRKTKNQEAKEVRFKDDINKLFDMSDNKIKDVKILELVQSQKQKYLRTITHKTQTQISEYYAEHSPLSASGYHSSTSKSTDDQLFEVAERQPVRRRQRIFDSTVTATLDRCNISDRKATFILGDIASMLGYKEKDVILSRTTIQRTRKIHRKIRVDNLKEGFLKNCPSSLILHWDTKLFKEMGKSTDRLAVLVSGEGKNQLLGVPVIESSTGKNIATAISNILIHSGLEDRIKGLCFDTTASNTGIRNGACAQIEKYLGRELLYLPCRHHIFEIILSAVFNVLEKTSEGPGISVFKNFQNSWENIDRSKFVVGLQDEYIKVAIQDEADDIIEFAKYQLNKRTTREDYRELLEVTIIFLGGIPPRGIRILKPGCVSRARWMAKAIYCLKIFMFSKQHTLISAKDLQIFKDICLFIVKIYVKYWYTCPIAAIAPRNDLSMLEDIKQFRRINEKISIAALTKMEAHTWYLGEHLIGLAFFDQLLTESTLSEMLINLKKQGTEKQTRKTLCKDGSTLADFVTSNTIDFFKVLGIPFGFINSHPNSWKTNAEYQTSSEYIKTLNVVNDSAERSIALTKEFNEKIAKKEDQKQSLLFSVEEHRRSRPSCSKKTFFTST